MVYLTHDQEFRKAVDEDTDYLWSEFRWMEERDFRSETFHHWPRDRPPPERLVSSGFFYTGSEDTVVCYHCGRALGDWHRDDSPESAHLAYSPECKMVRGVEAAGEILTVKVKPFLDHDSRYAIHNLLEYYPSHVVFEVIREKCEWKPFKLEDVLLDVERKYVSEFLQARNCTDPNVCMQCRLRKRQVVLNNCGGLELCWTCSSTRFNCPQSLMYHTAYNTDHIGWKGTMGDERREPIPEESESRV